MPDTRRHRGPHPADGELFAPRFHEALRAATEELAWLLGRGYAVPSALKLVGDRHQLRERQRMAVLRSSCSDAQRDGRASRQVDVAALSGTSLHVDGYNVLITLEAALAGGVLMLGRDGCLRDLASFHGHFKRVSETEPAVRLLGEALRTWDVGEVVIYLDQPVSNSGRLVAAMREIAQAERWPWRVDSVPSPDAVLRRSTEIVATADSALLDVCGRWVNLARAIVETRMAGAAWIQMAADVPS